MNAISRSSSSFMDADASMLMDTSQEFDPSQGGVVRWVASQSPNPALQALMKEAERDRRTRPSTPIDEPTSWSYPLTSVTSSTPLSTSLSSACHSSGRNSTDVSHPSPLSGSSSSASSKSSATRASDPPALRYVNPLSTAQRRPLVLSTSSVNQLPHHSMRLRSSSHSNLPASKEKYVPQGDEPETSNFMELLKQVSRHADVNSVMKQKKVRAAGKGKKQEESQEGSNSSARAVTKTASASAVCPVGSSAKAPEKTLTTSMSASKSKTRGCVLTKEPSLGVPGTNPVSGSFIPTSVRNPNLNSHFKHVPAPASRSSAGASSASNIDRSARKTTFPGVASNSGKSATQNVIDLSDTDTEWEKSTSGPFSRADTAMCMDSDDEESDTAMDISFYKPEPPSQPHVPLPKRKPQPLPPQPTRSAADPQRTRTGPPPLGMRRTPQFQPSQYVSTQGSRDTTVPRFKPPLLINAGALSSQSRSRITPATASSSRPPPQGSSASLPVASATPATSRDSDSSFDLSFGLEGEALEAVMRRYDPRRGDHSVNAGTLAQG